MELERSWSPLHIQENMEVRENQVQAKGAVRSMKDIEAVMLFQVLVRRLQPAVKGLRRLRLAHQLVRLFQEEARRPEVQVTGLHRSRVKGQAKIDAKKEPTDWKKLDTTLMALVTG